MNTDAGLFLCEFVYFKALYYSQHRIPALFIHVPPCDDGSDFEDYVQAVLKCIVHNLCVNLGILRRKNWKSKLFKFYLNLKTNLLFTTK